MADHYELLTLTAVTAFPASPQIDLSVPDPRVSPPAAPRDSFQPDYWLLQNESTTDGVEWSWDGTTVAGRLVLGRPTEAVTLHARNRRIWFRRANAGGVDAASVRVSVWSIV